MNCIVYPENLSLYFQLIFINLCLQIFNQLKLVNFTTNNGFQVSFDTNGDPPAVYELINWQFKKNGALDFVTVGQYDSSRPRGEEFRMSKSISWFEGQTEVLYNNTDDYKAGALKFYVYERRAGPIIVFHTSDSVHEGFFSFLCKMC